MAMYWGEQSVHRVLERTTWHSAQHIRQLIDVLDSLYVRLTGAERRRFARAAAAGTGLGRR
jgi:hypothetical protein